MAAYDFDGRVAFLTRTERGQERSHALHSVENGAFTWLSGDDARFVTGIALPVAGTTARCS